MKSEEPCGQSAQVAAYVAGELTPREEVAFAVHLEQCSECRAAVAATRRVVGRLVSEPQLVVSEKLATQVMQHLAEEQAWREGAPRARRGTRSLLARAAVLALLGGMGAYWGWQHRPLEGRRTDAPGMALASATPEALQGTAERSNVEEALAWLCAVQEEDGSWDAVRWGGDRRFQPALTALPLLALVQAAPAAPLEGYTAARARALASLCRLQGGDGAFGAVFQGAPYNQGIVTLALLHVYRQQPAPELKEIIDRSLALILARQTLQGGWGYLYTPSPNLSVSLWHLECLRVASELGWPGVEAPLVRGQAWRAEQSARPAFSDAELNEPATSPSREIPSPLEPGGALLSRRDFDYSQTYFLAEALKRESDATSLQRLAVLRRTLRASQEHGGEVSGSWKLDDRWSRVGGRLYTTALATLALR